MGVVSLAMYMHSTIKPFVSKTYALVNEANSNDAISWNEKGDAFVIKDQHLLEEDVLPRYFKHNNISSFIRQLNMYQFHKLPYHEMHDGKASEADCIIFAHRYFLRDREDLLYKISRHAKSSR